VEIHHTVLVLGGSKNTPETPDQSAFLIPLTFFNSNFPLNSVSINVVLLLNDVFDIVTFL